MDYLNTFVALLYHISVVSRYTYLPIFKTTGFTSKFNSFVVFTWNGFISLVVLKESSKSHP